MNSLSYCTDTKPSISDEKKRGFVMGLEGEGTWLMANLTCEVSSIKDICQQLLYVHTVRK